MNSPLPWRCATRRSRTWRSNGWRSLTAAGIGTAALLVAGPATAASDPGSTAGAVQIIASLGNAEVALPARPQIQAALQNHPRVAAAQARLLALKAAGDALRAGPNETVLRTTQARRRSDGLSGTQHEWTLSAERVLRSADKQRADALLAGQEELLGDQLVEDARHETARELLHAWFGWLRGVGESRLAAEQLELVSRLSDTVGRRLLAGDAARLEAGLANAELERARAGALLARAREEAAGLALRSRFPDITAEPARGQSPVGKETGAAAADAATATLATSAAREQLRVLYLARSHELLLARAESRRAQLIADRLRAQLRSDPSIGVFTAVDRGGSERVLGVALSLPLAGPARDATLRAALAEHQAAQERARDLERRLQAAFEVGWSDATARTTAAWALTQAAQAQSGVASQMGRAYSLGEASLSDWLQARRSANDAQQQALGARLDAAEASARLRLDLHELPGFDN
jgi:outer membrane protein TolC